MSRIAGNRSKGITVEIGGDTTKLQTALKGVNTEIRNTQSQLKDVEADSGGETEAGTTQRDMVRHGVAQIPVSFSVTAKWLKKLAGYAKLDKISVQYFDVETAELKLAEMYVTGYKAKLKKDTSYKGLWTVSFTLKEM